MRAKLIVLSAALLLTACAADDPYLRAKTGAAVGAVAGAVLGHQLDGDDGRYYGAAAGAAIGGGVGYALDRKHQQLQQLAAENQRLGMEVQRLQDGTIKVNIPSEVSFDFDSAAITPAFRSTLDRMAQILNQEETRSTITIVGHTDSTGPDDYNWRLSQRRAESVASYLASRGVAYGRLITEGRGETQPRASNDTAYGRQQNRRVEMFIRSAAT